MINVEVTVWFYFPKLIVQVKRHTKRWTSWSRLLNDLCAKFQAALARAPPFQRDHPEYQCKLVFQVWKENTQSTEPWDQHWTSTVCSVAETHWWVVSLYKDMQACVWETVWLGKLIGIFGYDITDSVMSWQSCDKTCINSVVMACCLTTVWIYYLFVVRED